MLSQAQFAAFLAVTFQRACHNSFLEWAKGGEDKAKYTVSSVIFVSQLTCVVLGIALAFQGGGKSEVQKVFASDTLKRFAKVGALYAVGDIFEMESVNYVDSSTYTVLSQSKLVVTAALMYVLEGKKHSLMQWFILMTTSLGMLEYVLVGKKSGGSAEISLFGISLAVMKVMISCYVAVVNAKALKEDKNSFAVKFASLKISWSGASFVYMIMKDGFLGDGSWDLFGEWTYRTYVLVMLGFVLKTFFNQYLLQVLDALWKNISEAIGVILVYFGKVCFLGGTFDGVVCNAAMVVVFACISFVMTKEDGAKKKSDVGDELDPSIYKDIETSSLLRARGGAAR